MKQKLMLFAVATVAVLLLIAGCSKQAPVTEPEPVAAPAATQPTATTPQVAVPTPTQAAVAVVQDEPAVPPEITQADETEQELGTSDLDQIDKDIDDLAVP